MTHFRLAPMASLAFLISMSPVLAQTISSAERTALQLAIDRGQQIYSFDQAAWHTTDALMAEANAQGQLEALTSKLGGWIVREIDIETLEVVFFDRSPDQPKLVHATRLTNNGTRIVARRFLAEDENVPDALTLRMIRARQSAIDAIKNHTLLRCTTGPVNIVVLPSDTPDSSIPVYILTPPSDPTHVPFGGHSRVMVAVDGKAGPIHAFTKGCMELPNHTSKDAPAALVATQVLDPIPTEIAVFTMFAAGLPFNIITPDRRIWALEASGGNATIRLLPTDRKTR